MMDLNFFEPYSKDKKQKKSGKGGSVLPYFLAGILLIAIIGITIYNIFSTMMLNKAIDEYQKEINDPVKLSKLKEVEEKEAQIKTIEKERAFLEMLETDMKNVDSITKSLMELIASKITNNLYLTTINVNLREISIEGNSLSKLEIAQFEYNIRSSNKFDNIYIDRISKVVSETPMPYYTFTMKFRANPDVYGQNPTTTVETQPQTPSTEPAKEGN